MPDPVQPAENLFTPQPSQEKQNAEVVEELLRGRAFHLERIVSTGQATPEGQWYDQDESEWVVLLSGAARVRFADESESRDLQPGDALLIPAHSRHRVEWTSPDEETIWLALHFTK